jgi:AcrR family transcriptional regulator
MAAQLPALTFTVSCYTLESEIPQLMPPTADKNLEERIMKAAQRLWQVRGARGLTLRAVARAAGTTTPTVYKRFRNKQALQIALALRFRQQLNEQLFSTATLEEAIERYVRFAEEHPNEYQLLWGTWTDIFHPNFPRPGRAWFLAQLAGRFGGAPEDYGRAFYAFFLLGHGAATLLAVPGDEIARDEVRQNFSAISGVFLRNIELFRQ